MAVVQRDLFLELCSQLPLFAGLAREELWGVANQLNYVYKYTPGDTVIRQGERDAGLFVLLSGQCKVVLNDNLDKVLETLTAGQLFGELSLLTGRPRSANVVAQTPSIALKIDHRFLDLLPHITRERIKDILIKVLIERIDRLTQRLAHAIETA